MRSEKRYKSNIGVCVTRLTLDSMSCPSADTLFGMEYLKCDVVPEALRLAPFAIEPTFPKFVVINEHALRYRRTNRQPRNLGPKWVHRLVLFFVKTMELLRIAM